MNTDYRKLCVELFGTDDVNELKKLAKNINAKNPRNAGRKKMFSQDDNLFTNKKWSRPTAKSTRQGSTPFFPVRESGTL